jgi:hypothetical protein
MLRAERAGFSPEAAMQGVQDRARSVGAGAAQVSGQALTVPLGAGRLTFEPTKA